MIRYKEITIDSIKKQDIVVYGCGKYGEKCVRLLDEYDVEEYAVTDMRANSFEEIFHGHKVLQIEEFKEKCHEKKVILTIQKYKKPYEQLISWGCKDIIIYYDNKLYACEEILIWGKEKADEIIEILSEKKLYLISENEKLTKDFMYVFDWVSYEKVLKLSEIGELTKDDLAIVMSQEILNKINNKENYILAEDLFPLLDYNNNISEKIPSLMMKKTYYARGYNQWKCKQPFEKIQLSSDFSVHCCCGDWAENWGFLENNSLEEIWKSDIAKIFRCSILNRTYVFCNWKNCVHLTTIAEETYERIEPAYEVSDIPEYIEIGIDKTCNLYCRSCRNSICIEQGKKKEKNEHITKKIIDSGWLEQTPNLLLGGQGEVFVSPIYRELMFGKSGKRKTIDLRSNGTLFKREELNRLMKNYAIIKVIISIDAANENTYNYLRRNNNKNTWNDLMDNLEMLSKARISGDIDWLQINMCVQSENYKEIPEFVKMGELLQVDLVYLTPIRNWGTYSDEEFKDISVFIEDKKLKPEIEQYVEKVRSNNLVKLEF